MVAAEVGVGRPTHHHAPCEDQCVIARALVFDRTALAVAAGGASAQAWPAKPVTIVAPVPAGGGVDLLSRAIAGLLFGPA